jgi:hypothetical protein
MSRDYLHSLNHHLNSCIVMGYHHRLRAKCPSNRMTDLNRAFNFKYSPKNPPTNFQVIKDLYSLWITTGCSEYMPDPRWVWPLYYRLKDLKSC